MSEAALTNGIYHWEDARIMDRSGDKRLPIGDDGFESVARRALFVDKSMLIADVLDGNYKVTLFCRPRRFGKTLAMTMLRSFFELPTDGVSRASLFEGLEIWDAKDGRYRSEQGVRPVIYFSLNDVKKPTWEEAYAAMEGKVAAEYARHAYVLSNDTLTSGEREQFERVHAKRGSRDDVESSLRQLALYLRRYHSREVVILIDEYDAPVMAGHANGYYREIVSFMKGWLTGALKDGGAALDFACLTGVQRIAKESIFSDLNNLGVDTPLDTESEERFGFTEAEVAALSEYLGHPNKHLEVKEWYDGYRFGNADIYNPWSVLNYFGKGCRPDVYWANTASNTVVGEAISSADEEDIQDVYRLLQPGGVAWRPLDMGVVFPEFGASGDTLWSLLYLAGYLTTDDAEEPGDSYSPRPLRIPNKEIARVFRGEVIERFSEIAGGTNRLRDLHKALATSNAQATETELARILKESPSCRDLTSENSYHMLVTGLLFGMPGYGNPRSNREEGRGYYDLRLYPEAHNGKAAPLPVITVELKVLAKNAVPQDTSTRHEHLLALAKSGLNQIGERGYDSEQPNGHIRYGIAFCGKDVAVAMEAEKKPAPEK